MTWSEILSFIIAPLILALGGFVMKTILGRIEVLESRIQNTVSESEVRQILCDKIDPLREDLRELKDMQQHLLDLYITDKYKRDNKLL